MRTILRYVHDFFRNFLKSFSIFYIFSKIPGAGAPGHQNAALTITDIYIFYYVSDIYI